MTILKKIAYSTLALTMMATSAAAVDRGNFNTSNVSSLTPFGTLPVDESAETLADVYGIVGDLSYVQLVELNQRCAVIGTWRAAYAEETVIFCDRVLLTQDIDPYSNDLE